MVDELGKAQGRVDALCRMAVAVTEMEAAAAGAALASMARRAHPDVRAVLMGESDQGDWLEPVGWSELDGGTYDLLDDEETDAWSQMTMHLYGNVREAVPGLVCLTRAGSAGATWSLDVVTALAAAARSGVLLESVVVRDPDGPVTTEAVVGGVPVRLAGREAQFTVDAGAGWLWEDWVAHRDQCLAEASDGARGSVLDGFREPPGGRYVDGRGDRGWLDGVRL